MDARAAGAHVSGRARTWHVCAGGRSDALQQNRIIAIEERGRGGENAAQEDLDMMRGFVLLAAVATASAQDLEAPVKLTAGGEPVDTGKFIAHAGPLLADYDGDGKPDLLVGNFKGHIQLYKNVGTREAPEFKDEGLLSVGGEPVLIHNW
jgi:hypothetical protein